MVAHDSRRTYTVLLAGACLLLLVLPFVTGNYALPTAGFCRSRS